MNTMEIGEDGEDHGGESKRRGLKILIQAMYRRIHWGMFGMMIMMCLVYGIVQLCINLVYSSHSQTVNTLYKVFLHSSNLSFLSLTSTLIQSSIITFLLIITLIISSLFILQLKQLKHQYCSDVNREQNYALQLTLVKAIKKSQVKGFVEYFEEIVKLSVNDRIFALSIGNNGMQHQKAAGQLSSEINYLQSIISKITIVQDVIILNHYNHNNSIQTNTNNNIKQATQQQSQSDSIIVLLSYSEMKQTMLNWWRKEQNRQKLISQVLSIDKACSPVNYLWAKLCVSINNNSNTNTNNRRYYQYVIVSVLLEITYLGLLSTVIYFQTYPQQLFTQQIITSYSTIISYTCLLLQTIIMTIYITLFQQKFVNKMLTKSIPQCITLEQQFRIQSMLTIVMLLMNILIAPLAIKFIVLMTKNSWDVGNVMAAIESTLWGQCQLGYLLICYITIKWILYQGVSLIITAIKRNLNYNKTSQNQHLTINHYHNIFTQFAILFAFSIFINPAISVLLCLGLLIKIKEFLYQFENVNCEELCFVLVCDCFERGLRVWCGLVIVLGGLVANSLLIGYTYGKGYNGQFYTLIIFPVLFLCMVIFMVVVQKKELNSNHNTLTTCQILPSFPQQLLKTLPQHDLNIEANPTTNTKEKKIANLLIQRIHTNQHFLYTYNEQLRKSTFLNTYNQTNTRNKNESSFQMIKRQCTNKVTQQLNTMSRSLQETLKQRLMTRSTNPFHIAQNIKQQQEEFDYLYEKKVHMTHSKPKTVRIPMLFLPDKLPVTDQKPAINRKSTMQGNNMNNRNNQIKKQLPRHNEIGSLPKDNNNNKIKKHNFDSDMQYDLISSIRRSQSNSNEEVNDNMVEQVEYQRKVRFTDLFDSDEESIKNMVKKKIKMSIPKIAY